MQIVVDLPIMLKKILLADQQAITEEGRLVPLPRSPCVSDVLVQYADSILPTSSDASNPEEELVSPSLLSPSILLPPHPLSPAFDVGTIRA